MELKIGCTGWSYPEWQGTFYPKTIKQKDWLRHYSSIFDTTEVNSSFYRIIPKWMAQKWFNETPENFKFSLKFPGKITHDHKLEYSKIKEELMGFFSGLEPLKSKISVLVFQLPPSLEFKQAKPRLDEICNHLPHYCRYAVEGRHESWFSEEAKSFLGEKNFCLVWNEVPMVENPAPITTDFIYLRMIGDRELPEDVYDHKVRDNTETIQKWAKRVEKLKENNEIKIGYLLSNNHLEGFAPSTVNTLRANLGLEELKFKDKSQDTLF
jgi:uncharacterized protein YecE (DUF72 family)